MPFFSLNGHFEALETNVTVQFKDRKLNMYSGVPKLTMANTSKYYIKLCLGCRNLKHRLYAESVVTKKKAAQSMIKWLT